MANEMPKGKAPLTHGITVKKHEDMSEWYNQVVVKAELADYAPTHGMMIIRPHAYAIWESIQNFFNPLIEAQGVRNAYFPLLIPESFFHKEKEHFEGFEAEVAWVERKDDKEERVALRPTSETIMYDTFSRWVRSHRDLPLKINQWCNVIRWEIKQTKLFLRTREFLWQEGHCAYASHEECLVDAKLFLQLYQMVAEDLLAIPVIPGFKTKAERFAGADETFTIEGFMPDGKALQMGTSHDLGTNFAKPFNVKFQGEDGQEHLVHQGSWGFSTRLIGAVVMAHGDDKGLVLPPRAAKNKVVIVPILFDASRAEVLKASQQMQQELKEFGATLDDRDNYSPGWKFNEWEMKGIPIRIEIGPKDLAQQQCVLVRRDTGAKKFVPLQKLHAEVKAELDAMHHAMLAKARAFLDSSIVDVSTWKEFESALEQRKLIRAAFCGQPVCEKQIKDKTTATSRCIALTEKPLSNGICIHCNEKAEWRTLFSKAY